MEDLQKNLARFGDEKTSDDEKTSADEKSLNAQKSFLEVKDVVNDISSIASDMLDLVRDLLDVGRVEVGGFSIDLGKKIDLRDVVRRAVRLNYDYSLKRRISLISEVSDDVPLVNLDAKRMKQILTNLISNSVKYSPEGSKVKVLVQKNASEEIEIIVEDNGFGMSEEQVALAFNKYQTIRNPNSGMVDSFGLGLPIVKELVELQGGKIEMKSKVGVGTRVRVSGRW